MAGLYTPIITFYPTGVFTITSNTSTPYFVIQNSMGSFLYGVNNIYFQANTTQQLFQGFNFRSYDVNGDINSYINVTTVDPYQYQNSIFLKPIRKDIVLDGRTSISFNLLPSGSNTLKFRVAPYEIIKTPLSHTFLLSLCL